MYKTIVKEGERGPRRHCFKLLSCHVKHVLFEGRLQVYNVNSRATTENYITIGIKIFQL